MKRMHLKDGNSIGLTEVDTEDGTQTRLNLVVAGLSSTTVTLTTYEEEDLIHLIETGSVRLRCSKCGCLEEHACIRVDGEEVLETCSWAELDPEPVCTACIEGAEGTWKHPDEQVPEFWPVKAGPVKTAEEQPTA